MSLVQIAGSAEVLRAVVAMPEIQDVRASLVTLDDGNLRVAAYASDEAVEAAVAAGAVVVVLISTEAVAGQQSRLAAAIEQGRGARGEA
ncbi:hypothetical protein [Kitasatospora sp. NPDC085879]|uniref:hypothetical protein n=1 Tax=Kitasatospora sp. NPDC085879 TaxID=3154769 RepID=UPI000BB139E2|nr:hypothetical protein [Streptomyces sp. TLI_235]PBC75663.1 hypothetical protein BX265_0334 [Streptomyces sp. TLI_235]